MRELALYKVREFGEHGVRLAVRQSCTAHALLLQLLGSKAAVQKVFARRQLVRAGQPLLPTVALQPGELVDLGFGQRGAAVQTTGEPLCHQRGGAPRAGDLIVLYDDPLLMAVDKQAGILVHGDGTGAPTLTTQVQALCARQGRDVQVQAVQRLDVETTGLVLFSLTEEFQPKLDAQVAGHDMHKRYLAVIEGHLPKSEGDWLELTGPIGRDRHHAQRMRVSPTGKPALTRVLSLARRGKRSLLLVELATGRRHQIRVHLAAAAHPLLGDALYGGRPHAQGLMLHAWEETLVHPLTDARLVLRSRVPERFELLFPHVDELLAAHEQKS